jgi:4-amino-4-deoxy-L-arabinose transferase-like glycosyltransferase
MVARMCQSLDRRDVFALVVLGLIGVGIPLGLSAAAGAVGLPTIDDWVYIRGADSLFRTGTIDMPGHTAAAVGQLLMVQPLLWLSGGDPWAFTAFGLIMTTIGIVATYLLARRFLGTGSAVAVVLFVEAFPGFAREAASYMTDVPGYALAVLCLLFGTSWFEGGRRSMLVLSLGVGLLAVSVREFAIAAPAAVLVVSWARSAADRVWLAVASVGFAAAVASVLIGAASIPGRSDPTPPEVGKLFRLGPVFATFAAVLLPALVLRVGRRMTEFSPEQVLLGAGLGCLAALVPFGVPNGMLWAPNGIAGDLILSGTRNEVIGAGAWALSRQVASFAAILLAAVAFKWAQQNVWRVRSVSSASRAVVQIATKREGLLIMFLLAYGSELVAFAPIWVYDRYLFPLIPVAAILLLRGPGQASRFGRSRAFADGAFAWLAISAFAIASNSFAYDAARWREGIAAVANGYDATTVDAGYEWVGYHASTVGSLSAPATNMVWSNDRWAFESPCAVISNSELGDDALNDDALVDSGLRLVEVHKSAYWRYLFFGPAEPFFVYGASSPLCPPLADASGSATSRWAESHIRD